MKGLFNRPSKLVHPGGYGALAQSITLNKLGYSCRDPVEGYHAIAAHITHLLFLCLPFAVAWFVISVIVYSTEAQSFGSFAHVGNEVLEGTPTVANGDASQRVAMRAFGVGIRGADDHGLPNAVGAGLVSSNGVSMRSGVLADRLISETPARLRITANEITVYNHTLLAAFTKAQGLLFSVAARKCANAGFGDYFKPSKVFTDQRYFGGHNDGSFIVASSGGVRLQPASLRNSLNFQLKEQT